MANPTHKKLFITRDIRLRKEHILDSSIKDTIEVNDLMRIAKAGTTLTIVLGCAYDLIVAKSAIEDNSKNRDEIAEAKLLIEQWRDDEKKQDAKSIKDQLAIAEQRVEDLKKLSAKQKAA